MDKRQFILGGIALASACCSAPAFARGFKIRLGGGLARGGIGSANSANVLTRAELETCMRSDIQINEAEQSLGVLDNELSPIEDQLSELGRQIDVKAITLDRYSEAEVAEYNGMVEMYESMRADFNRRIDLYNDASTQFNLEVDRFNLACGDKNYYEDDMLAVRLAIGL